MTHPITAYRNRERLNIAELARRLNVDRSTVLRWEQGVPISTQRLLKIERETGIPREELRPDLYEPRRARARA